MIVQPAFDVWMDHQGVGVEKNSIGRSVTVYLVNDVFRFLHSR